MNVILQSVPENLEQKTWVKIQTPGIKDSIGVLSIDDKQYRAQIIDGEMFAFVSLGFGKISKGTYTETKDKAQPFVWSDWVIDDVLGLIPEFRAVISLSNSVTGPSEPVTTTLDNITTVPNPDETYLTQIVDNNIRKVFRYRTFIKEIGMTILGDIEVYTEQDIIPFTINVSCNKDIGRLTISRLYMVLGEESVCNNAKFNGLSTRYLGNGKWSNDILGKTMLYSGFTATIGGAILCRNGKPPTLSDENRLNNLLNRKEARVFGRLE